MGFDVTAANVIFFIAFLTVGSAAMGAYWTSSDHIEEARRTEDGRTDEVVHTVMIVEDAVYNAGQDRFSVEIKNSGSTVIAISSLVYLIDGAIVDGGLVASAEVPTAASPTDLWLPTETLEVVFLPIDPSPSYFQVVEENGVAANWGI